MLKQIFAFLIFMVVTTQSFASGISATNGVAQPSTCDTDTLETSTGPAKLRAEFTPEVINLRWYNDDTRINVPTASSTCTYDTAISLPTNPTKPGYKFAGWDVIPGIPIQYIESTGTQWIDTGFKFTGNIVKYDLVYVIPTALENKTLFGASDRNVNWSGLQYYYDGTGVNSRLLNALYIGGRSWAAAQQDTIGTTYVYSLIVDRNNHTFKRSKNGSTISSTFTGTVTNNVNIALFAHNMGGGRVEQLAAYKVYSFKITQDGVVVRDMIPIKDYDNVPCMYDQVSKQCFYNAGTGNFIAGPEI